MAQVYVGSYIISRNIKKRPTLMHKVTTGGVTACGVDTRGWSKSWFKQPIDALLCMRCKKLL
jgi:hypothetical protein